MLSTSYDPATYSGWNNRPYNWDFGATVTQQLSPGVGHSRVLPAAVRQLHRHRQPRRGDGRLHAVRRPVPSIPGCPTSGTSITAFDVAPSKFGHTNNLVAPASSYGTQTEHWNGVDFTIDARPHSGFTVQGGFSTGRTVTDDCDIVAKVPETLFGATSLTVANAGAWLGAQYCRLSSGFLTQVRGLGAYTIPRLDVQLSATFQSRPGAQLAANFNASQRPGGAVPRPQPRRQRPQRDGEPDRARLRCTAIGSTRSISAWPRS